MQLRSGAANEEACGNRVYRRASVSESQGIEPFQQGLRELGYIVGQNIIVEVRPMEGKPDRLPDIVAELVQRKVDVIFSATTGGAQAR